MMKLTKSKSLNFTKILVEVTFLLLILTLFMIPEIACWYDAVSGEAPVKYYLIAALYACNLMAFFVIMPLFKLITNLKKGEVFVVSNTKQLRMISTGLYIIALIFALFAIIRPFSLMFTFLFAFIGLILTVVKNVFEEAVLLQEEQNYTI